MRIHTDVTLRRVTEAVERAHASLEDPGFCICCGAEAGGVEPDARKYECESCGEPGVYGAEELLLHLVVAGRNREGINSRHCFIEGLARTPPSRAIEKPLAVSAASIWVGCAQLTV